MTEKLCAFIQELTPEQVEILIAHLAELTSLLEESSQPYPLEQFSQTP